METFTIIGYGVGIIGAIIALTSKTKTDNLNDLKERVEILEKEREYAREEHLKNQRAIANLEGQLKTYKEIPLKEIAESLKALATSQDKVLARLDENARIAKRQADTGGVLVKNKDAEPLTVKNIKR